METTLFLESAFWHLQTHLIKVTAAMIWGGLSSVGAKLEPASFKNKEDRNTERFKCPAKIYSLCSFTRVKKTSEFQTFFT